VNKNGVILVIADLGGSSNYSNEMVFNYFKFIFWNNWHNALKTEVEKVSLRAALVQGLVGPKISGEISNFSKLEQRNLNFFFYKKK